MRGRVEVSNSQKDCVKVDGKVSVIMPAYNEEENIEKTIEKTMKCLQRLAPDCEIIVVDDGSTDCTYLRAKQLSFRDSRVKVIRNGMNRGKGYSVKRAARSITGDFVVILDADLEIDPYQLGRLLTLLQKYDVCIASKRHPQSIYKAPFMRKLLSIGFNKLVRLFTGIKFSDTQTGLKAMRAEPFKKIMSIALIKRYAYDVEVLALAQLMGLRIAEVPVKIVQKARFGIRAVIHMLIDLLGITYRLRIKHWYQRMLEALEKQ